MEETLIQAGRIVPAEEREDMDRKYSEWLRRQMEDFMPEDGIRNPQQALTWARNRIMELLEVVEVANGQARYYRREYHQRYRTADAQLDVLRTQRALDDKMAHYHSLMLQLDEREAALLDRERDLEAREKALADATSNTSASVGFTAAPALESSTSSASQTLPLQSILEEMKGLRRTNTGIHTVLQELAKHAHVGTNNGWQIIDALHTVVSEISATRSAQVEHALIMKDQKDREALRTLEVDRREWQPAPHRQPEAASAEPASAGVATSSKSSGGAANVQTGDVVMDDGEDIMRD